MKKALFIIVAAALAFVLACQPANTGNVNGNSNVSANNNTYTPVAPTTEQTVRISAKFVSGSPPELIIADVDPNPVVIRNGQKLNWSVAYEAPPESKQVLSVTIDDFKNAAGASVDLFGGGSKYEARYLTGNSPSPLLTTGAANSPASPAEYKYKITFVLEGLFKTTLDPRIVISN